MLKSRNFWVGFALGYLLVALVPAANLLAKLSKGNG